MREMAATRTRMKACPEIAHCSEIPELFLNGSFQWEDIGKIIELNGEISSKPCLISVRNQSSLS
jgi:hypothetical protein